MIFIRFPFRQCLRFTNDELVKSLQFPAKSRQKKCQNYCFVWLVMDLTTVSAIYDDWTLTENGSNYLSSERWLWLAEKHILHRRKWTTRWRSYEWRRLCYQNETYRRFHTYLRSRIQKTPWMPLNYYSRSHLTIMTRCKIERMLSLSWMIVKDFVDSYFNLTKYLHLQ